MISPQAIAGLAAFVLVLAAGAYRALSQSTPETLPAPKTNAPIVEHLTAATPVIPPFETFYVNNLNPFVPADIRKIEQMRIEQPQPALPPAVVERASAPPPKDPPPLVLPVRSHPKDAVPDCVGLVAHKSGRRALLVRFAADQPAQTLVVGDEHQGWRLDAIDGTTARWTSPTGEQRAFVVAPDAHNAGTVSGGDHTGAVELKPEQPVAEAKQRAPRPVLGNPSPVPAPAAGNHAGRTRGHGRDPGVTDDGKPMPRPVLGEPPKR